MVLHLHYLYQNVITLAHFPILFIFFGLNYNMLTGGWVLRIEFIQQVTETYSMRTKYVVSGRTGKHSSFYPRKQKTKGGKRVAFRYVLLKYVIIISIFYCNSSNQCVPCPWIRIQHTFGFQGYYNIVLVCLDFWMSIVIYIGYIIFRLFE